MAEMVDKRPRNRQTSPLLTCETLPLNNLYHTPLTPVLQNNNMKKSLIPSGNRKQKGILGLTNLTGSEHSE